MTLPGSIAQGVPDGPDWLVRAVRDLQRQVSALSTATPVGAVRAVSASGSATNWSLGTAAKELATTAVTIPAGFTRAVVNATSDLVVFNQGNADVVVNAFTAINFDTPDPLGPEFHPASLVKVSTYGSVSSTFSTTLDGLVGGQQIIASAVAYVGSSLPASPTNGADLNMTVLFLR